MRYEIKNNEVLIFIEDSEIPCIAQPSWPDGTSWGEGEAESWAKQFIKFSTDPTAEMPGDNPANPTKPRPVAPAE